MLTGTNTSPRTDYPTGKPGRRQGFLALEGASVSTSIHCTYRNPAYWKGRRGDQAASQGGAFTGNFGNQGRTISLKLGARVVNARKVGDGFLYKRGRVVEVSLNFKKFLPGLGGRELESGGPPG